MKAIESFCRIMPNFLQLNEAKPSSGPIVGPRSVGGVSLGNPIAEFAGSLADAQVEVREVGDRPCTCRRKNNRLTSDAKDDLSGRPAEKALERAAADHNVRMLLVVGIQLDQMAK